MYTHKDGKLVENRVMLPESKVRIMDKGVQMKEILHYKERNDWSNATHLASLFDILGKWNIDLTAKDMNICIIIDDCILDQMPKDTADVCIDGLKELSIHNDTNTLEREISLLSLFMGLNGLQHLGEQYKEAPYSEVQINNNLTAKASEHWNDRKGRYSNKANTWILTKIIKLLNKDYYESTLKPLIIKLYESKKQLKIKTVVNSTEKNEIDLIDLFTLKDVSSKALNGNYQNKLELIAQDLLKIIRIISCQNSWCYIIKEYNCLIAKNVINYKSKSAIYDQLRSIRLWADGKKHITGIDALEQYHSLFEKLGIKFISDNLEIFNVFYGFKYIQIGEVIQTKIEQFLALMKDTISANDERVQEYLLNWFAFIVQKVGKKTETAIILKGLKGISKNVFTNVLCELIAGYSSKNITDIDDFVGKFNIAIENKMLAIDNEMKNFGDSRMSKMDALKSKITEDSFVINEKFVPNNEIQNVVNVMIVTNNINPLKIENSDRRYVVCECHPVHGGDLMYFINICNSFDADFYNNLFTFFLTRDISQFNPRDIPMTQAKKDIILASVSPVDEVIIRQFKSFGDGVTCSIVEGWKPQDMKLKNYQLSNKSISERVRKSSDGERIFIYKMKEEMILIYENMLDEDIKEDAKEEQLNDQAKDGMEYD
ncbi:MAG: hypothetical protein EZS28_008566 [Streblomastix strix]|uniref:NrS-1 polymerase-like helicase domain-containing protein n=1 Tax=Streblomastix strix TaxID=222440 RepID=A0A5J4WMP4_9EUKA|nr:MAG: hypothetical protein EZS28_008566 [Streblomastix strix]